MFGYTETQGQNKKVRSFLKMNVLNPPLSTFVGHFRWIVPLTTYYWLTIGILFLFLIFNRKILYDTKILILNGVILLGLSLFVLYLLSAFFAHTDWIHTANKLGGMTEKEKKPYFVMFRYFFVYRTSLLTFLITTTLFERFSLLPYVEKRRRKIEQHNEQ